MPANIAEGISGLLHIAAGYLTPMLRPYRLQWGTTPKEALNLLPGDELVPNPTWQYTHAISIHAPTHQVWPWLAQIGQGRGGFYTYIFLENLIGCKTQHVDRILPQFQAIKTGDAINIHPKTAPVTVARVDPGKTIVLLSRANLITGKYFQLNGRMPQRYANLSWSFHLEEVNAGQTRLITRWRADYSNEIGNQFRYGVWTLEPLVFVMERQMLLGIKERAENEQAGQ